MLKRIKDPVRGTGLVVAVSQSKMKLVLEAPGVPPTTVEYHNVLILGKEGGKAPHQGNKLPVTIDRSDPTRFRIEWDEVTSELERLKEYSKHREQQLLDRAYDQKPSGATGMPPGFEDVDPAALEADPELRELLEMEAAANEPVSPPPHEAATDVAERLRKLDELKAIGAINPQEFEEQRQRIIDSI